MNQSSVEKKGWSAHSATSSRPVTARASFRAAVVASEPFLVNFTISAPRTQSRNRSATVTSMGFGRTKFVPCSSSRRTASTTGGNACPSATARSPIPYSMYSFPSRSQTWHPRPRAMNGGAQAGYWSSPLA